MVDLNESWSIKQIMVDLNGRFKRNMVKIKRIVVDSKNVET